MELFENKVNVSVTGASENGVFKWKEMEEALTNNFSVEEASKVKLNSEGIMSDIHADSIYRANLVNVMAIRAVDSINE